jgi:eukaryotic-like serine/threonine-protein kinase
MEFLEGLTLASLVHRFGALPLDRALNISAQVARALAAAHALSIVHRDLKPENVMLLQRPGQADFVKVIDFGVAKISSAAGGGQGGQTALGVVVGTPQYMSPEQAKGLIVDARTDIYALGLIVYELVSGRPVFIADTPSMLLVKHVTEIPPALQPGPLADVPDELEQLIFSMLEKDPGRRPQLVEDVAQQMEMMLARVRLASSAPTKVVSGGFAPVTATATATPLSSSRLRATDPALAQAQLPSEAELAAGVTKSKAPLVAFAVVAMLAVVAGAGWAILRQPDTSASTVPEVKIEVPQPLPLPPPIDTPPVMADVKLLKRWWRVRKS